MPEKLVEELSFRKADAVRHLLISSGNFTDNSVIIGCDTVVAIDNKILGKPKNREDAALMLNMLSGNEHKVISGLTVLKGDKSYIAHEVTKVYFKDYSDEELRAYLNTDEAYDKAGAYAIQGYFAKHIEKFITNSSTRLF